MSTDASTVPAGGAIVDRHPPRPPGPRPQQRGARDVLAASRLTATLATAALLLIVLGALAIVAIAASHPGYVSPFPRDLFPGWMSGPLRYLGQPIHIGFNSLRLDETIGIGGAFFCWLAVIAWGERIHARLAIGCVVAAHLILFLSPPLSLTDIFNYVNYGRMGVVHHLNPYTTTPNLEPHTDPSFLISNWHHLLSPYGPLFTLLSYALVPLGVAASFWVLKALLLAASLATLRLIWLSALLLGRGPLAPVLFVGANPLVLLWGLGGDHNDFFMVFFVVLTAYLLLRARAARIAPEGGATPSATRAGPDLTARDRLRRAGGALELWAGASLVTAVAIKASAGVLLPVLLFATSRRRELVAGMLGAAAVLGAATVVAFGPHLPDLSTQSKLVTAAGLPNLLGIALGQGGETQTLRTILNGLLVIGVGGATFWAWRTRRWIPAAGFSVLALLLTLSWELPWYVYWLLPLAALSRARSLRIAAVAMSAYLILAWMPELSDFLHTVHFRPSATPLGLEHGRITKRLLH